MTSPVFQPRIAIVMPAYNEADRIEQTIRSIQAYRLDRGLEWPVVLADDGSLDQTIRVALGAAAAVGMPLHVLEFSHRGKALTIREAMLTVSRDADADYLMMLDADDELRVDQLDHVEWSQERGTIYIARRVGAVNGSQAANPTLFRRLMSAVMRLGARVLLGLPYPDTQCGFKLFPRAFAADLFGQQTSASWVFDAEILAIGHVVSGLPIVEVPVTWRPRGVSRVKPTAAAASALSLLGIAWRLRTGHYRPVVAGSPAEVAVTMAAAEPNP